MSAVAVVGKCAEYMRCFARLIDSAAYFARVPVRFTVVAYLRINMFVRRSLRYDLALDYDFAAAEAADVAAFSPLRSVPPT